MGINLEKYPGVTTFYLGVTDWCNLNCKMCPQRDFFLHRKKKGFLDKSLLRKIFTPSLKEVLSSQAHIFLMWLGESTLYPHWEELLELLFKYKDLYQKLVLYTNGTNYQPLSHLISKFKDVPLQIIFSLDASWPQTYFKIKGKPNLKRVEDNIRKIIKLYKDYPFLEISLQFLIMEDNFGELEFFLKKWSTFLEEEQIDYGIVSDYSLEEYGEHRFNIAFRRTTMENMDYSNNLYLKGLEKLGLKPHFRYQKKENDNLSLEREREICTAPFRNLTVNWDGRVTFCCYDSYLEINLGSLKTESLIDIWRGKKANLIRKVFWKREFQKLPLLCQRCFNFDAPPLSAKELEKWKRVMEK